MMRNDAQSACQFFYCALIQALRDSSFYDTRLTGAPAPEKLLDPIVRANVHFPGVAWGIAAALGRVRYNDSPGGTSAHRQFVHASIFHFSGGVPAGMEGKV